MIRSILVLCLTLVLVWAPAADAQEVKGDLQEERFSLSRWLQPFSGVLDWLFAQIPTFRSEGRKAGAMISPSGITASPPLSPSAVPSGEGIPPQKVGAMIDPSG